MVQDPTPVSRHRLVLSVVTLLALAYGSRVEDTQDRGITPGNLRAPPNVLAPNHQDPRTRPARTARVIRRRHQLAQVACCSRVVSGTESGCSPNLGRNPSPTWRSPIMRPRSSRYLPLLVPRLGHAVADARLGEDVSGFPGVVAQLLAQVLDEGAHRLRVALVAQTPDLSQQLVVA